MRGKCGHTDDHGESLYTPGYGCPVCQSEDVNRLRAENAALWDQLTKVKNLVDENLMNENAALRRLADAVRGFRAHGEAKNGTHGTLMFKALDELDSQ